MENSIINDKSGITKFTNMCPYSNNPNVAVDFYDPKFIANPEIVFQKLRSTSPIQKITLDDGFPIWLFSTFDDVTTALRDPRFIKSPDNLRCPQEVSNRKTKQATSTYVLRRWHMLANDPPKHTRLRGFAQKAFTPKIVANLRIRIQQIADELIDLIEEKGGKIDFINDFAYQLPIIVISELLGLPIEDREKLRNWSDVLIEVQVTEKNKQSIDDNSQEFTDYLKNVFAYRRKKPGNDLISAFLKLEEAEDHMSEEELYATIFLLIIAGHETTVNLISNGMHALLTHPDQLQLLKHNPQLIHLAVEEMLRYNGPVLTSTMRLAAEDIVINDITIKKGEGILVLLSSANQDETKFENPLQFDITRKTNKHVGFGYGLHFCIGAPLARLECEIAINTVLKRLPSIQFDPTADSLEWRASTIVRGLKSFPVIF